MSNKGNNYTNTLHTAPTSPTTESTLAGAVTMPSSSTSAGSATQPSGATTSRGPDVNTLRNTRGQEARFFCDVDGCPSQATGFTTKASLQRHITDKHSGMQYICLYPGCGRKYADSTSLNRHIKDKNHAQVS
ncbi:hypothetical protein CYLTODRAFT_449706 [Cylindrobasidium torrendii FP15055 ss-10]|uniref:C2H2-type domain-containing protein n=1 Tax=Cylindrobasidium torrendii FP15055 ss-10 TaxID=1314674 RepID=A0A0D7BQM2_9AGAR|nr:hypothetical protein CYLTODRAFT_449706 [Cylindrobasidium torrendii FP15055 ss-10]